MKKMLLSILMITLLSVSNLSAQTNSNSDVTKESIYARSDVLKRAGLSFIPTAALITGMSSLDSVDIADLNLPAWMLATMGVQHLPLYFTDTHKAKQYSAFELGSLGLFLTAQEETFYAFIPLHFYLYSGWYSSYDNYATMRNQSNYSNGWRSYEKKELIQASFNKKILTRKFFWITMLTTTALNVLDASSDSSIWANDKAYIDEKEYKPLVALPIVLAVNTIKFTATAVAEEALFRGIIYEEMKYSWGSKKAKFADMILFPAIHVPGDINSNKDSDEVINNFIFRGISTLLFDFAYDRGGLPLSIALHTWFNTLGQTIQWTKQRGVPPPPDEKPTSSLIPSYQIGFSINF